MVGEAVESRLNERHERLMHREHDVCKAFGRLCSVVLRSEALCSEVLCSEALCSEVLGILIEQQLA